ncbi:MAG: uracil-DNA glycosylase [Proteobacteria bacterium]|jgi:uracil-DNA glycosylase|nr:uracil-DNA glycosylase [Pseudomonadota bacterium]MDA0971295.1 uracil-DNA glycosylase [Pseudomonadota bacterium]
MKTNLETLNKKIIACKKCPRLVAFKKKISTEKRRQYINETYWGKPITGHGDVNAKILIVGLAPAAHGGTRTGRVFTGDASSTFLFQCLYKAKLCNQPTSVNKQDGLQLYHSYITTVLKCVPPLDKPLPEELKNCSSFFRNEIILLKQLTMIVALGKIAFDACIKFYKQNYKLNNKDFIFSHGKHYALPDGKTLVGCYHPSPRNVNTGRININKMTNIFMKAKRKLKIN